MPTLFAVFLAIFVSQVSVNAAEKIRIGFNPGASGIYFPLAQKMGFLKEEGIEAEVIRLSGGVAVAGMDRGDAHYYTALSSLRAAVVKVPFTTYLWELKDDQKAYKFLG